MVTLSNGHGYLNDCDTTTGFTKTDNGNTSTFTIDNGDYFKLDVTVSAAPKITNVVNNANIGKSTNSYPQIRWRYKCSNANIYAKIQAEFDDASLQDVLPHSNSQTWTVGTATLTSPTSTVLDHIWLYANLAVGTVYYDFALVFKSDFTLPNVAGGMNMDFPPQEAVQGYPLRDTELIQNMGTGSALIDIGCDLDQGTWKRTGDTIDGEVFLDMLHNRSNEPWQWLNTGSHQFKVTVHPKFRWVNNGDGSTSRLLDLVLKEYSAGSKDAETYAERYGIGL